MGKKRKQYTKEYKFEAVRLIVEEGRRISELSRELGISASLLRNWVRQSKVDKIEHFPGDELLNGEIFYTLKEATIMIERWRIHYNTKRPHTSLGYRPPAPETIQIPNTIMTYET